MTKRSVRLCAERFLLYMCSIIIYFKEFCLKLRNIRYSGIPYSVPICLSVIVNQMIP